MIFSERYQLLFIENPIAASTSISAYLQDHLEGVSILTKHASIFDFDLNCKNLDVKHIFMVKRNPFERELSRFYKLKNHEKEKLALKKLMKKLEEEKRKKELEKES